MLNVRNGNGGFILNTSKKLLFFSLVLLCFSSQAMRYKRVAFNRGLFRGNALSALHFNRNTLHVPFKSSSFKAHQYLKRNFRAHKASNINAPLVLGVALGTGAVAWKTHRFFNDEITLEELQNQIKENSTDEALLKFFSSEKNQENILKYFVDVIDKDCGDFFKATFIRGVEGYLKKTQGMPDLFVEKLSIILRDNAEKYCCKSHKSHYEYILEELLKKHPSYAEKVFSCLKLSVIEEDPRLYSMFMEAIKCMPSVAESFKNQLLENFLSGGLKDIEKLQKYIQICIDVNPAYAKEFTQVIEDRFSKNRHFSDLILLKKLKIPDSYESALLQKYRKTSSIAHAAEYTHHSESLVKKFIEDKNLASLAQTVIDLEAALQNTHHTFVHGQRKQFLLYELLHTFFTVPNDFKKSAFLDLHVEKHNAWGAERKHKKCIAQGCNFHENNKSVLFMNSFLFGNLSRRDECSAAYIESNFNITSITITAKKVFEMHGYGNLFEKYRLRLEALNSQLQYQITDFGTCIFIAIPKNVINDTVYVAAPVGKKEMVTIQVDDKLIRTDDVNLILETFKNDPKNVLNADKLIFCMPMTTYQD